MNLSCPICSDNIENENVLTLPCSCYLCYRCMCDWIKAQSEMHLNNIGDEIKCPCDKAHQTLSVAVIISELPLDFKNQVYDIFFQNYLQHDKAIRKCPNYNCSYAGIIECCYNKNDPLECMICKTKWRDSSQIPVKKIDRLVKIFEDIMSLIWEIIFTKECPFCQILIEKNDGCSKIKCKRCSSEFCWSCLKSFSDHDPVKCRMIFFIKTFITGLFIYHLLFLLGIIHILFWVLKNIFVGLFANIALMLGALIFKLIEENSTSIFSFGILVPSSIVFVIGFSMFFLNKLMECIIFFAIELIIYGFYKFQRRRAELKEQIESIQKLR